MSDIHITLQGKGGVGKTLVSSILAQYFNEKFDTVSCIDTDPVNATFYQYDALNVERLEIMDGSKINERNFDSLMEKLLTNEDEGVCWVIDNGASSFVPLSSYLIENGAIQMLTEAGHNVIIHTVITAGLDTLQGFSHLAEQFDSSANIVVWKNEFFGEIEVDGKSLEEMKVFTDNKKRVQAVLTIHSQNADTFGKDMESMLSNKMTFDEAIESGDFQVMAKQRLKMMKANIFNQMKLIF